MSPVSRFAHRISRFLSQPVSDAPLRSLRWAFGLVMAGSTLRFWLNGWAGGHFAPGRFAFHYYGLGWVPHPGLVGLQVLLVAQLAGALALLHRPLARVGAGVFFVSFVWMQALDATWYLNHYYFAALVALGLALVPGTAGGATRYTLAWFRLQTGILYVCAGLFKLEPDWLLRAEPLRIWLAAQSGLPLAGPVLVWPPMAWLFSWGGMLYDLAVPFLLVNRRTALPAYVLAIVFHGLVGWMFDIGIFPWLMLGVAPVFFPQGWHERFWVRCSMFDARCSTGPPVQQSLCNSNIEHRTSNIVFLAYFTFQILFPFRFLLYPGKLLWHEQGYRFSWRVLLMEKVGTATFYVQNSQGRWGLVDNNLYLTGTQERMMATQPDFILQYAHWLGRRYARPGQEIAPVRAKVYVTLNGRPSRLFVNPVADLTRYRDGWGAYAFLEPAPEP